MMATIKTNPNAKPMKGGGTANVNINLADTNIYVDSVSGNDGNDGTITRPYKTVAKLETLGSLSGRMILLKRGSLFREQFHVPAGSTVDAYGSGTNPIITGVDPVDSSQFTLTADQTYTYEMSYTPASTANPYATITDCHVVIMMWEDGIRMGGGVWNKAANVAAVEATANRWYFDDATKKLYVHASDGSNPATNGKLYEASTRTLAISIENDATIKNLIGDRSYALNGIGNQGYQILFQNGGYAYKCTGRGSWNHNLGVANELVSNDLLFESCYAYDGEEIPGLPNTMFIAFKNHLGGLRSNVTFKNCVAKQPNLVSLIQTSAFYAHGGTCDCVYDACSAENTYYGAEVDPDATNGSSAGTTQTMVNGFTAKNCTRGVQGTSTSPVTLDGIKAYGCTSAGITPIKGGVVSNSRCINCAGDIQMFGNGTLTISDCIFANNNGHYPFAVITGGLSSLITFLRNSYYQIYACIEGNSTNNVVVSSDYNNFFGTTRIAADTPGNYFTLAAWQAAGFDANSTEVDPGYDSSFFTVTIPDPTL